MSGLLEGRAKLLMLQFTFSSKAMLPSGLAEKAKETISEMMERRSKTTGIKFIDPVEKVSISLFPKDLMMVGYVLVDAFYTVRTNAYAKNYYIVRFIFATEDNAYPSFALIEHQNSTLDALLGISQNAIWRVRAFLNPFVRNGEIIDDCHSISINLDSRRSLINNDGSPVIEWEKDEQGKRIGTEPVPVKPKLFLRIKDDDIRIIRC
ncbi:MAG: hypothetical protein PHI53_03120 [Candidatus Pacebacteria bacterium]|nr:hypothetical protein [Candidatus Paceibacterota bacterium]